LGRDIAVERSLQLWEAPLQKLAYPRTTPSPVIARLRPGNPERQTPTLKGYVYILASGRNGTIYIGVTSNPRRRMAEHQQKLTPGFTSRYGVTRLVWLEEHDLVTEAIHREKRIKKFSRAMELRLIEEINPQWNDLSDWLFDVE
jgi:putative endonuclease